MSGVWICRVRSVRLGPGENPMQGSVALQRMRLGPNTHKPHLMSESFADFNLVVRDISQYHPGQFVMLQDPTSITEKDARIMLKDEDGTSLPSDD